MNAKELMEDAPEVEILFERCLSTDYGLVTTDFFYMQGLSERDRLRFPNFNPADGHWYGSAVCVAAGICQSMMKEDGYASEFLEANEQFARQSIAHEIETAKGNPTRRERDPNYFALMEKLLRAEPSLKEIMKPLISAWNSLAKDFIQIYEQGLWAICQNVDFSSPAFRNSQLFQPLKDRRLPSRIEVLNFQSAAAHEIYPFTSHLTYSFL